MIDVQIVAGKRPELIQECIRRVSPCELVSNIFVANNTGAPLGLEDVEVLDNEEPLTFEQNHNRLAKLGKSPFILFLDDDAFLFEGAIETLFAVLKEHASTAAVGALNNQSFPTRFGGVPTPTYAPFAEFQELEPRFAKIAEGLLAQKGTTSQERIFLPGNCLLVRRRAWQKEYGGWDEEYLNWNEEVDFLLWCWERGYETRVATGVWFFHCQAQSRARGDFLENIVKSSIHHYNAWPHARFRPLLERLRTRGDLGREAQAIRDLNARNLEADQVQESDYYKLISGFLE